MGIGLELMVSGETDYKVIAEDAGVGLSTVYSWMDKPHFVAELEARQGKALSKATLMLRGLTTRAVRRIGKLIDEGGKDDAVRLKAACEVLSRAGLPSTERKDVKLQDDRPADDDEVIGLLDEVMPKGE